MSHKRGQLGNPAASIKGSRNLDRPHHSHVCVEHTIETGLWKADDEDALWRPRQACKHSTLSWEREARELV